jgi:succinate dehydrogenase / fumarate reductase flavoprotein subunit
MPIEDKSRLFNTELQEAIELGHMLDYSTFIVKGALAREESRGAHFREDFPERNDEKFLKHTMAYMNIRGDVAVDYIDVKLGIIEVKERTY